VIKPPSLQRTWDAFTTSKHEPAIIRPPADLGGDATQEQRDQHAKDVDEWAAKILAARDTGQWGPVTVEGQQPTRFTLDQVNPEVWREIHSRASLPDDCERKLDRLVVYALLFRLALRGISGWDRIERQPDPAWSNWTMAPLSVVAHLDAVDPFIVSEIGLLVLARLAGERPLS